jgi:putative salt-induced outer membrane protein YdiY
MKRLVVFMMLVVVSAASAQDEVKDGWQSKVGLGVDISSGNSEVTALLLDLSGGYTSGANLYSLEATYGYAETEQELSRQNSRLSLKYDRQLSRLTYVYVRVENEYDKIALLDYRFTAGPGVGRFLVKNDDVSLKCDVGVSYIEQQLRDEELANNLDSVVALRVTERLDVKLSETASAWQSVEYLPDTDDFDSYLMNAEVGLETRITGSTSLKVVAASRRNSMPPDGVDKDDLSVKASLAFAFGK